MLLVLALLVFDPGVLVLLFGVVVVGVVGGLRETPGEVLFLREDDEALVEGLLLRCWVIAGGTYRSTGRGWRDECRDVVVVVVVVVVGGGGGGGV